MGIYDRDYMRRDDEEPDGGSVEDRLAGRVAGFFQRHPWLPSVAIAMLVAVVILVVVLVAVQGR